MSDIFISYAREDLDAARRLAEALELHGWSVFWDRTIPAGKTWREVIGAALAECRCVVVLWSKHSISSKWVLEEADHGSERDVLIPALIEKVRPPLGFGSIQAADLSSWNGSQGDAAFQSFLADAAGILGGLPAVAAQAQRKAEAERAAPDAPAQSAADARRGSRVIWLTAGTLAAGIVVGWLAGALSLFVFRNDYAGWFAAVPIWALGIGLAAWVWRRTK